MFLKKFVLSEDGDVAVGVGDGVGDAVCARALALDKKAIRMIPKWQSDLLFLGMVLLLRKFKHGGVNGSEYRPSAECIE
jgi:hypothetical protein